MQNKLTRLVLFWFGTFMATAIICCGFLFLTTDILIERLPPPRRTWFAIIFLVYGGFRAYRQYAQFKRMQQDEE
jgi:hypothetical protein